MAAIRVRPALGYSTKKLGLSIKEAITGAQSKAAGIDPAGKVGRLLTVTERDWHQVLWVDPPLSSNTTLNALPSAKG